VNGRVLAELLSDVDGVLRGEDDVDDTVGDTGTTSDLSEGENGVGGFGGSLEDDGVTGSEGSSELAGNHRVGEVPGSDYKEGKKLAEERGEGRKGKDELMPQTPRGCLMVVFWTPATADGMTSP
jgi:hypothetical protein